MQIKKRSNSEFSNLESKQLLYVVILVLVKRLVKHQLTPSYFILIPVFVFRRCCQAFPSLCITFLALTVYLWFRKAILYTYSEIIIFPMQVHNIFRQFLLYQKLDQNLELNQQAVASFQQIEKFKTQSFYVKNFFVLTAY